MTTRLRSTFLLSIMLPTAASAMSWLPFPFCTDTHQVDSILTSVRIDESLIPENAPYLGHAKFRYHPGTCFIARTEQKPYYMDTLILAEATLSPDRRRQDFQWLVPGPVENRPQGTRWFSPEGDIDSSLSHSFGWVEGEPPLRTSFREVHLRTAQYWTITSSLKRGEGPWMEYAKDSVVTSGGVTTVFTVEEDGTYRTRCANEGSTYVCLPTPIGDVTTDLNRQVWHLTGNRIDSLRTYREDGRLESTDRYSWSARTVGAMRRPFRHSPSRAGWRPRRFDLQGRSLPASLRRTSTPAILRR